MGDGRISFRPSVAFTLRAASLCKIVPDDLVIINKLKFVNNPCGAASFCDSFKFRRRHISDSNSLRTF